MQRTRLHHWHQQQACDILSYIKETFSNQGSYHVGAAEFAAGTCPLISGPGNPGLPYTMT